MSRMKDSMDDQPRRQEATPDREQPKETPRWKWFMIVGLSLTLVAFMVPYTPSTAIFSPHWLQLTSGLIILITSVIYIFYRDIRRYKPLLADNRNHLILLSILLGSTVAITRFSHFLLDILAEHLPGASIDNLIYAIPIAAGSMLVSLLFDVHLALVFSFVVSLMSGVIIQETILFPLFSFCGCLVGAFSVMQCGRRSALIHAGIQVGIMNMLTISAINLYHNTFFTGENLYNLFFGFLGGIVVATIVSSALPALESLFNIATDIKLLELLDMNQPLLKKLLVTAPGTYHHSIVVGNIAEAAAEAVGVNPLVARVASFYHDIGKINNPEYYIENQAAGPNPHNRLAPEASAKIITTHTVDGAELAQSHHLPPFIVDVIAQHHGSSLLTYFHEKAKERAKDGQEVISSDYRYRGPKPSSKVSAIIMMADACEAAVRSIQDPTTEKIAAMVNRVITNKFIDDQFTECDLTLKDLQTITTSIVTTLCGIFHQRIDYPGMNIDEERGNANPGKKRAAKDKDEGRAGRGSGKEGPSIFRI